MKIPPGMSQAVTHRLIIADRSEAGMTEVTRIEELIPVAGKRIGAWRNSTDRFFIFVVEEAERGRIGSVPAKDLNLLLSAIQELFDTHLLPPANPAFDIFVAAPDGKTIHEHIAKGLLATVALLERGIRP